MSLSSLNCILMTHFLDKALLNPSSLGDTIWCTQLLAPCSGYPHMVSLRNCSESFFTAKNNHLQFEWLIFDNSKQFFDRLSVFWCLKTHMVSFQNFCQHWSKLLHLRSWMRKLPCEFRRTVCFTQFVRFPAHFLHQLSIIMTADREPVDDISETVMRRNFVGFSREEFVEFSREERLRSTRDPWCDEIAVQVVDQEWTRTLKATNIPPFSVVTLGLTNILNENYTELNFCELLFTKFWWEKPTCTLSRKPQWSQIKTKAEYFWPPCCWFPHKRRQNDELASTEIVN